MAGTWPTSLPVETFHEISNHEAVALVDALLDPAGKQKSATLRYRLDSEFQSDWKAEVGHWLNTAQRLGFDEGLWSRAYGRLTGGGDEPTEVDPNDARHRMLQADLAAGMVVHVLAGTGWMFDAWEPTSATKAVGAKLDVDMSLVGPNGTLVDFQVKAPDQPGRTASGRRLDGERDDWVLAALDKGAEQLPKTGSQAKILAVCSQRSRPLIFEPHQIILRAMGGATQLPNGNCVLPLEKRGSFFQAGWRHVGAVLLLDLVRGEHAASYGAMILVNPRATIPVDPAAFAFGRVCTIAARIVRWRGGAPRSGGLPDGTLLVDHLP